MSIKCYFHICGEKQNRILYAYMELFNYENSLIILNMDYEGNDFSDTYCLDLLKGGEIEKQIKIRLTRQHFLDLHLIAYQFEPRYIDKYDRVMRIIESRQGFIQ